MHKCCCIFCEGCWNECHKHDARCPMCRQNPKHPAFPAYQVRKDIGKLRLRCPRGCGATFLLLQNDSLLQHLEECSFKRDASNLALQATQTEQTRAQTEQNESSSDDEMAVLWREMQALTRSVKRILQILFLFRCSSTEILRCRKRRTALD